MESLPFNYKGCRSVNTTTKKSYSTSSNSSLPNFTPPSVARPTPIRVFNSLDDNNVVLSYRKALKSGVYCFINTVNGKLYIGSVKDLYLRLIEHLSVAER